MFSYFIKGKAALEHVACHSSKYFRDIIHVVSFYEKYFTKFNFVVSSQICISKIIFDKYQVNKKSDARINRQQMRQNRIIFVYYLPLCHMITAVIIYFIISLNPGNKHAVWKFSQNSSSKCTIDGWPKAGTEVWWDYYRYPHQPTLSDAFEEDGVFIGIFNARFLRNQDEILTMKWKCDFNGIYVNDTYQKYDPHKHTFIVKCKIPKSLIGIRYVSLYNDDKSLSYKNVLFCKLHPPPAETPFITAVTQNLLTNATNIMQWVAWHHVQGFDTFIVYLNNYNGAKILSNWLNHSTQNGLIKFIDWNWPPKKSFLLQQSQEMSSIYRLRKRTKYLALFDIDERFFCPPNITVRDFILSHPNSTKEIGGFRACNQYFMRKKMTIPSPFIKDNVYSDTKECDFQTGKNIIRPENVEFFSVHTMTEGKVVFDVNSSQMIKAHYKYRKFVYASKTKRDIRLLRYQSAVDKYFNNLIEMEPRLKYERDVLNIRPGMK